MQGEKGLALVHAAPLHVWCTARSNHLQNCRGRRGSGQAVGSGMRSPAECALHPTVRCARTRFTHLVGVHAVQVVSDFVHKSACKPAAGGRCSKLALNT